MIQYEISTCFPQENLKQGRSENSNSARWPTKYKNIPTKYKYVEKNSLRLFFKHCIKNMKNWINAW